MLRQIDWSNSFHSGGGKATSVTTTVSPNSAGRSILHYSRCLLHLLLTVRPQLTNYFKTCHQISSFLLAKTHNLFDNTRPMISCSVSAVFLKICRTSLILRNDNISLLVYVCNWSVGHQRLSRLELSGNPALMQQTACKQQQQLVLRNYRNCSLLKWLGVHSSWPFSRCKL